MAEKNDILIISDDVVGRRMAGPGIRAWEIARSLSRSFSVRLAVPDYSDPQPPGGAEAEFPVSRYSPGRGDPLRRLCRDSRIILTQGYTLAKFPFLKSPGNRLIIDMYVPFPLENLFTHKWKVPSLSDREFIHMRDLGVFNRQLALGDYFLCASPRQRDLLVGSLTCLNRIRPEILDRSPGLEALIGVVPFGITPDDPGERRSPMLRSSLPGLRPDDVVLIWGGVITNWFDPLTLLHALKSAREENDRLKLFFMSTAHPNPLLPEFDMAGAAVELAESLGLKDRAVFFNEGWIDYAERGRWLGDADIGVSIHRTHFETHFSFRTRMLDYLKHGLPILCTEGDYFAELVQKEGLGLVVGSEDRDGLARALVRLGGDDDLRAACRERMGAVRDRFLWEKAVAPLRDYCRAALAGEIPKPRCPSRRELRRVVLREGGFRARGRLSGRLAALLGKLPPRAAARIKRLLRFPGS